MHGEVGLVGAMHAEHAEELPVVGRIGAEAHQRAGDGEAGFADEFDQRLGRALARVDDAAAGVDHRPLGGFQRGDGLGDLPQVGRGLRAVGAVRRGGGGLIGRLVDQDVLGQIDHHRAGPAGARDIERLMHHPREILGALDEVVVLGRGAGDAGGVGLLEGVVADQMGRHLAGQAHERDAVHQRIDQARHRIGGAGAGGDEHAAHPPGGARIALRGMHRGLLVAHQDVADRVLLEHRIIDRQHRAAGIAENHLDALLLQRTKQHFGARLHLGLHLGLRDGLGVCLCLAHGALPYAATQQGSTRTLN